MSERDEGMRGGMVGGWVEGGLRVGGGMGVFNERPKVHWLVEIVKISKSLGNVCHLGKRSCSMTCRPPWAGFKP